jgi:hypothetical protein
LRPHWDTIAGMTEKTKLDEFIERAKAGGATEESLVGILTARGWPEKEVYEALAAHYERVTSVEIPRRGGAGTAAKDAFFYLLVFSTLATWTIGLGSLAFTLIDRWLADTLFSGGNYYQGYDTYSVAAALASILVAFPIYLLVSRGLISRCTMPSECAASRASATSIPMFGSCSSSTG